MLSPYRVLDLTDERGHLAGCVLAALGAEVIKIEPPGGVRTRSTGPSWTASPSPTLRTTEASSRLCSIPGPPTAARRSAAWPPVLTYSSRAANRAT